MKTIKITRDEILTPFSTPPRNQGQIVEVSYGGTENFILERTYDASDRTESIVAYLPKAGADRFEPQNGIVPLGRRAGKVVIVD